MINAGTEPETIPPTRPRRWLWWVLGPICGLVGLAVIVAALVPLPYYTVSPGSVWPTLDLVEVDGAESYPSDGQIGFTTVSLSSERTSALEAALGWLDPAVEVVDEEDILGDQTPDENRERNLQYMDDSKQTATALALETLGYDVAKPYGARVFEVEPTLPAADILEPGDLIVGAEGEALTTWAELIEIIGQKDVGDEVTLEIVPFDPEAPLPEPGEDPLEGVSTETVTATLGEIDDDPDDDVPPRPVLGIIGADAIVYDFPFEVTIDSGEVGGPSAGLALTLAVLDTLTPEDITGGRMIATTGTIDLDGNVGPIGGVQQKIITARRAGVDLFILPSADYEDALEVAGDLELVRADTLDEALAALESVGGETAALRSGTTATS